jgi:hypothetical protein
MRGPDAPALKIREQHGQAVGRLHGQNAPGLAGNCCIRAWLDSLRYCRGLRNMHINPMDLLKPHGLRG